MIIILDLFFNLLSEYIVYNALVIVLHKMYRKKMRFYSSFIVQFYNSKFKFFSQT